jgi:glycerate dehydrogenase
MRSVFLDTDTLGPGDIDLAPLTKQLPELELFSLTSADQVAERIASAEIVIVNKVRLPAEIIQSAPHLKLICLAATGTDNVNLKAASEAGIVVSNIRNYCTPSVAQHVFALILALTQRLDDYQQAVQNGAWKTGGQFCLLDYPIRELDGKTMGIIGLGSLGSAVGRIAAAFNMRVIAARRPYDLTDTAEPVSSKDVVRVGLGALFAQADIISLHCPLTPATENLINTETLAAMRNDAILINTARGGLVDSPALVAALQAGQIAGAGIDVLRQEPPIEAEPLIDARPPNLIVTPHIAWAGRESRQRAVDEMAMNIAEFLQGKPRSNVA